MNYQTLMVHLQLAYSSEQLAQSNASVLIVAKDIAKRCNAAVIGVIVGQQTQMIYGKGYALIDFFDREKEHLEENIAAEKALFMEAFKGYAKSVEWRSSITMEPIAGFIVAQACCADLIITGITPSDFYEGPNRAHAGEIVMQSGRPVLAVSLATKKFKLENVLVGWKDTRESRRAIVDALPILKMAKTVTVMEITNKDEKNAVTKRLADVVTWLATHDVVANPLVSISKDDDASQFIAIAKKHRSDLIVAGAYGHSRLRQWVLGGITDSLLQNSEFSSLLSH
jgi:nucleotide-binding universal stress UspA family protein